MSVFDCRAASVVYRPPGEAHSDFVADAGSRCFLIEMEDEWLHGLAQQGVKLDGPILSRAPDAKWAGHEYSPGGHGCWGRPVIARGSRPSSGSGFGVVARSTATAQRRAALASRRIGLAPLAMYGEAHLTLMEVSRIAGVHSVCLATAFRRHQGCTIGEFVRQLRIERACQQMPRPDLETRRYRSSGWLCEPVPFQQGVQVRDWPDPSSIPGRPCLAPR
jgi:AraC-like DNA-binding protein